MTAVEDALARATARWPQLRVTEERLGAFAASCGVDAASDIRPDLVLACACLDGQPAAIAIFEAELMAPVASKLARLGISSAAADEAISRLRALLYVAEPGGRPKLAAYSGRGDLRGWLEVVARREAYKLALREPASGDDHILESLSGDDDLELRHIKSQHRAELRRAFADALAQLSTRDRLILRQRYLDRLTFDEVAALQGVHRLTVMRWLGRIEKELLHAIRRLLIERLRLAASEVDQLVDDARSTLDLSLNGLLGGSPP
jgi:RNA polymerase sigma-70 factor (ECF subfamily)